MPSRKNEPPVEVRSLAPPPASEEDAERLLYRPVRQLDQLPDWKVKYEWVGPERAKTLLNRADDEEEFRQRTTKMAGIRRWKTLMRTKRFVDFLPNGVICIDPDGVMLNGKHRMTALAGQEGEFGFVFFYDVPRWMFAYFDTNMVRTIKDVFHIGSRDAGPQTPSAMKLAMRYEEFLHGLRPGTAWRHWNQQKDEHQDVDDFLARRGELQDWYDVGEAVNRKTKLLVPSVMVFRFYQSIAWPEGDEKITAFCESLVTGGNLPPSSPVLLLRDWAKDAFYNKEKIFAKRELHLMLLFRTFERYMNGSRLQKLNWAYGLPMTMPYHPDRFETGLENVKKALAELDAEQTP
jgi:hypothetical protein